MDMNGHCSLCVRAIVAGWTVSTYVSGTTAKDHLFPVHELWFTHTRILFPLNRDKNTYCAHMCIFAARCNLQTMDLNWGTDVYISSFPWMVYFVSAPVRVHLKASLQFRRGRLEVYIFNGMLKSPIWRRISERSTVWKWIQVYNYPDFWFTCFEYH